MFCIKPVKTSKNDIKTTKPMKDGVILKHPFSAIISGSSGSGKTVLLVNMLTRPEFYKNYFDRIIIFSPTAGGNLDDSYESVPYLKEENFINTLNPEFIRMFLDYQEQQIKEKGIGKSPRLLLIFDDCIADQKFMRSSELRECYIKNRHYNTSVILLSQYFYAVPKTMRVNASGIFYFKGSQKEVEILCESYCPPNHSNKEFMKIIDYCTKFIKNNKEINSRPFLFYNGQVEHSKRYRKTFTQILDLKK